MSTPQTAQIYVRNNSGAPAVITLWHNNSDYGTESQTWTAPAGATVGPLTARFNTGFGSFSVQDYWAAKLVVESSPSAGVYQSVGPASSWKECQLQSSDAGKSITFVIDTGSLSIALPSGGETAAMNRIGPAAAVDNVFVLMLENHSFDNVFAFSGIPGIRAATAADTNGFSPKPSAPAQVFHAGPGAPQAMTTDPGHEFTDVLQQLSGWTPARTPWTPYDEGQDVDNSGFVANYATTLTEITKKNPSRPAAAHWGDVMLGFDTPRDLPVIYQLATNFAVCDDWRASIPGPTWPNRFFVHGASSAGWADSPGAEQIGLWLSPGGGFTYPSGASIYDRLSAAGLNWRIYADEVGDTFGAVPQVAALKGVTYKINTNNFSAFAADVKGPYPYAYTFIEPNYGDVYGGSYVGGSSQHPKDSMARGEALIKATYEAIRNSPLWERSLLIITYDEHGGFFDSVPPGRAPPPNDGSPQDPSINASGFLFDWYGVRVPAVVVSPRIPRGTVDHAAYDHASVAATLEALYGFPHMTDRDRLANTVLPLLSLPVARTDCPTTLSSPSPQAAAAATKPAPLSAAAAAQPLPEDGNTLGFLQIMAKTDMELARGDPAAIAAIRTRVAAIRTRGDAQAYAAEVIAKADKARASRDAAAPSAPTAG